MNWVNQMLTKAMSLKDKIAYKRRTLKSKSLVAKHGLAVVISLVMLGVILGVSWSFVYFKGSEYFSDMTKSSGSLVFTNVIAAEQATPRGESDGQTVSDLDESPSLSEIADMIWSRESSRGKNNYSKCEAVGLVNGIGYGIPGNGQYQCFDSHEQEMEVLENWIARHEEEGMSYIELICHYSGGNYPEC